MYVDASSHKTWCDFKTPAGPQLIYSSQILYIILIATMIILDYGHDIDKTQDHILGLFINILWLHRDYMDYNDLLITISFIKCL